MIGLGRETNDAEDELSVGSDSFSHVCRWERQMGRGRVQERESGP